MREIKFRAWVKKEKKMWVVDTIEAMTKNTLYELREGITYEERWEDECEIMQFTGLHDKNGKEIYEGDIVEYDVSLRCGEEKDHEIKKVYFANGRFYPMALHSDSDMTDDCWYIYDMSNICVIGNIYENPELLEDK